MDNRDIYLYVTPFFPTPTDWRGGYCYDMVRALARTGRFDIRVIRIGGSGDYSYRGIPVSVFAARHLPCGLAPFLLEKLNAKLFLETVSRMGIDWHCVSVCHLHGNANSYLAPTVKRMNAGCRVLLHHHCMNPVRLESGRLGVVPIHAWMLKRYYQKMFDYVDVQVFCSEGSRRSCSLSMRRSAVYYNGCDPDVFFPTKEQPANAVFTIGCVANFQPLKDQMTLIRAVARLRDHGVFVRVIFVGSGETLASCRSAVKGLELEDRIEFRQEVDHLKLPEFYRGLDLFVLPSRLEGFGCVYLEAMGCGVAALACRGVSIQEVFRSEDRDRFLFEPGDADDLARRIEDFVRDAPVRPPQLVRDFSTFALVEDFVKEVLS